MDAAAAPDARAPVEAFIGLGANLGDARGAIERAISTLAALPGTRLDARSRLYRSAPVDAEGPDYLNAVVKVLTRWSAPCLMIELQKIEQLEGRTRPYANAPRTLDLDLLLYGHARIEGPRLTVPHPRWRQRAFVLRPLAEIAPERVAAADLQAVAGQRCEPLG